MFKISGDSLECIEFKDLQGNIFLLKKPTDSLVYADVQAWLNKRNEKISASDIAFTELEAFYKICAQRLKFDTKYGITHTYPITRIFIDFLPCPWGQLSYLGDIDVLTKWIAKIGFPEAKMMFTQTTGCID